MGVYKGKANHLKKMMCSRFFLKLILLVVCTLLKSYILYWFLGVFNKRLRFIESVFLVYPGNEDYLKAYCFKFSEKWFMWWPSPVGVFKQGGKWGFVFAAPVFEQQFIALNNREHLKKLKARMDRIAKFLGVSKIHYAGILPSFLHKIKLLDSDAQNEQPALIVFKACTQLSQQTFNRMVPVILLGGDGSLGRYIQEYLAAAGVEFYVVDQSSGQKCLPTSLIGKPAILIDVARKGVLETYIDQFWTELVLFNETYPEPRRKTIKSLASKGIDVYHLSGVEGKCHPPLLYGYANTVPCCAMHADKENAVPVVIKL